MSKRWLSILSVAVVANGCGDEKKVETAQVQARTNTIITQVTTQSLNSISALSSVSTFDSLGTSFDNLGSAFSALPEIFPSSAPPYAEPGEGESASPEESAAEISEWLNAHVLLDSNLESGDEQSAVYLLHGATFCDPMEECTYTPCAAGSAPGCMGHEECTTSPNTECISTIDAVQVRVKVTLVGTDGLNVDFLIGPAKVNPVHLELRPSALAAELDLGNARAAIEHILTVTGEDTSQLPTVLDGLVRLALTVNGEEDVSFEASVLRAINFVNDNYVVDGQPTETTISIAAASPIFSLHVQGLLGAVEGSVSANAVDIVLPYVLVASANATNPTGTFGVHLAGLSAGVALHAGDTTLSVTDIGIGNGPFRITKDAETLVQIDLNSTLGRQFDLTVAPQGDSALFTLAPGFDLDVVFNLQAIAADFTDDEIPSFFMNETYEVALLGEGSVQVLPIAENTSGFNGGLKMVLGHLSLSSTEAHEPVTVAQGQCLVGRDEIPSDAHEFLGHLLSGACPE